MNAPRRICYVTGTRADFGLMRSTLRAIQGDDLLSLSVMVTGMHLSARYGMTVAEIEASGLPISARIDVDVDPPNGLTMATNIGRMLVGLAERLCADRPDLVLLLGDRGEMLAGALAALHLDIAIVHLHGGERSGTVDEPVRHAISKLSHYHFVATVESRERLMRMGEDPARIWVTGAPGLDGIAGLARVDRATLAASLGFDAGRPIALMVFHPVLQETQAGGAAAQAIVDALRGKGAQVLALKPNADAGSEPIREVLEQRARAGDIALATHLPREEFVAWMAAADLMVGNSSSGIIEAASFGTPVVNVGSRQNLRERNANVIDVDPDPLRLARAIGSALDAGRLASANVYGDGRAGERIVRLLRTIPLDPASRTKVNAY
ncbi:MAG: UDP-N-acetylglucosamine 2-epimerase (hydrolyzing) [Burkholderiaceae bacterium]|jgi:GDP/UDP-N,N'-diacetylbacillosamine 2-epimerase (hydrolysing)|nr:UDP-N-acetylglucosamine 2-epimerase (hydrolyzing) [Burkholderiaceae bacterium]MEB2351905.1 UDP-N-acetylglucosamine 2-epimerase [Burkholderiaceae bacterium]